MSYFVMVRRVRRAVAVEPHPGRAGELRERFAGEPVSVLPIGAGELVLPRRPFRVVASPPYAIGRELLRRLLTERSGLVAAGRLGGAGHPQAVTCALRSSR